MLRQPAAATATSIDVPTAAVTDWAVGDYLAVAPSGFGYEESEEVQITSITDNGDGDTTLGINRIEITISDAWIHKTTNEVVSVDPADETNYYPVDDHWEKGVATDPTL